MNLERKERIESIGGKEYIFLSLTGASFGLLLGNLMNRKARKVSALIFGSAAILTSLPALLNYFVTGPKTKLGSRRTLQGIRRVQDGSQEEEGIGFVHEASGLLGKENLD